MRRAELEGLRSTLERLAEMYPDIEETDHLQRLVSRIVEETSQPRNVRCVARAHELADLRRIPLGNALFTRDSFESEYGEPVSIQAPETVDLGGQDDAARCIYCDGDRFTAETYATDRAHTHVRFWWCGGCGLGRAVSWGSLDDDATVEAG
jgi:arginine deiminase